MNSSQSLPTFPRFQASTGPTVSSGGSVQSHLSSLTGSTQRRLRLPDPGPPRIHVHPPSPDRKTRPKQVAEKFNAPVQNLFFRTQLQTRFVRWPSILRLREGQSTASRASIMSVRLVILAYCAFSMLLFTATLFGYIGVEPDILQADVSPIRLVPRSLPQRSTSLHPAPLALNSLKTQSNDMTWAAEDLSPSFSTPRLTACVWAPESEIGLFANWSTQWPGESHSAIINLMLRQPTRNCLSTRNYCRAFVKLDRIWSPCRSAYYACNPSHLELKTKTRRTHPLRAREHARCSKHLPESRAPPCVSRRCLLHSSCPLPGWAQHLCDDHSRHFPQPRLAIST